MSNTIAKTITDHKWKNFKYGNEVPANVLADQFDHLDDAVNQDGFLKYKNCWYHVSDFLRMTSNPVFDGYVGHSYYHSTLIKISGDGEKYKIGSYFIQCG